MSPIKLCRSCGKVMKNARDFSQQNIESEFCQDCTDEFGYLKSYSKIIRQTQDKLIGQMGISQPEAEAIALANVKEIPHWARRKEIMKQKKYLVIVDIGSTTTKAILLKKSEDEYKLAGICNAATTVEKPREDVNLGVLAALRQLETSAQAELLDAADKLRENVLFLATSSAGGGLQIMVVGLTMFDSASSAKRTAFGAGGVILDTFAIDDKRSSLEQMTAMANLHPDIILMSGGVDGGAISPILRLGEILQFAEPVAKFNESGKIPLVFAGNRAARELIAGVFQEKFELFMVENLRPKMLEENLQPAREKIHQLFMDSVMEQAPGYSQLKKQTDDEIIPTPMGVIRSLQLVAEKYSENVMSVDIGGATTDIFSHILGEFFRTVSANYGMSYSISNVMKDSSLPSIRHYLPAEIDLDYLRNYVSNKMLYPTFNPQDSQQVAIEHALAIRAIQMSQKQHLEMNFNTRQLGFLDKMKQAERGLEKLLEAFYVSEAKESKKFSMQEVNIMIGAGGVLAHTENSRQALTIIYKGLQPVGITEIWRDRNFISPHLGKLSAVNEALAAKLIDTECYEKLATVIRPLGQKWKAGSKVLQISYQDQQKQLLVGDLIYLPNESHAEITYKITLAKNFYLQDDESELEFKSSLPLLIDCCENSGFTELDQALALFDFSQEESELETAFQAQIFAEEIKTGPQVLQVKLPYQGDILVENGQAVEAQTVIGENKYAPPRIYVISLFDKSYLKLNAENIAEALLIQAGDEVKLGQRIVELGRKNLIDELRFQHYYFDSPIRGRVEKINLDSGTIILREIQDYSNKPQQVNVAKILNIKPKLLPRYLKKNEGEFVYSGEVLGKNVMDNRKSNLPLFANAPTTGTITEINRATGFLTIRYDRQPLSCRAGLPGKIVRVYPGKGVDIAYKGATVLGSIGFGRSHTGKLHWLQNSAGISQMTESEIAVYPGKLDREILQQAENQKLGGIVAASIDNSVLVDFIGAEIGVALTGNEDIPFPLIITEGFGSFEMKKEYRDFFQKSDGKLALIKGHTQIRAGVTRPQIIVI
ncbi:MAG: glutamate mutase L [Candidatus Cloacimonadales bacterium]